jgi:hypothetical protein
MAPTDVDILERVQLTLVGGDSDQFVDVADDPRRFPFPELATGNDPPAPYAAPSAFRTSPLHSDAKCTFDPQCCTNINNLSATPQ